MTDVDEDTDLPGPALYAVLLIGAMVALCGRSWVGVTGAVVAAGALLALAYALIGPVDLLTRIVAAVCAAGVLLTATVALGLVSRRLDPGDYRRLKGERVTASVSGECTFGRARRRGTYTENANCKNAVWTTARGERVVGSVEVHAEDITDGRPFTVTAYALGDHASAASRAYSGSRWNAFTMLPLVPWWLLPIGLLVSVAAAASLPAARRRDTAVRGAELARSRRLAAQQTRNAAKAEPPVRTYRRPLIGGSAGAVVLAGGVWLITAGHGFLGGSVVVPGGLMLWTYLLKLLSTHRTVAGRPRLASRRGWQHQATVPGLLDRLGVTLRPGRNPDATAVLHGTIDERAFFVFDYRDQGGSPQTAYLVRGTAADTGTSRLPVKPDGEWLTLENPTLISPGPARIERTLDELVGPARSPVPPEPVQQPD